ncbi:MAG TPA: glycosyltransferase, partial [Methylomirabilota bacterium]|nr:glycosyltransferase [Methylomirabilota bacterium]
MRIAQLAPTYERVPPAAYGGTELIVHLLTEELVRRGHDVTLFASGDSVTAAALRSVTPMPVRYGDVTDGLRHAEYLQLANAQACFLAAAAGEFDMVHNHAGVEGLVLAAASRTPVLTTNHNPFVPQTQPIWDAYPWAHHAVSAASAATFPSRGGLPPIHHGIDVESFSFGGRPEGYLLFLGRFMPDKGAMRAIEAARLAGHRLVLAGKVDTADVEHFTRDIEPAIDGDRIRYVGEADADTKRRLLSGADALLFPIEWDEPFGLVMIEALASGT